MNPQEIQRQTNNAFQKHSRLNNVAELEAYIIQSSPLPISYDVNRPQHWYFTEYCYTEFMGGIIITPMNDEMACKHILASMKKVSTLDVEKIFNDRLKDESTIDKYVLKRITAPAYDDVVILPGSNILNTHVNKELLMKIMWERPGAVMKPHPLTNENDLKQLKKQYGHYRVLMPELSGWDILQTAKRVYATSSTELATYACFFGKQVDTINSILWERTGSYYPVFRMIAGMKNGKARKNLLRILTANSSGVVFPEDPNYKLKVDSFFEETMKLRKKYKPLVYNSFSYPQLPTTK